MSNWRKIANKNPTLNPSIVAIKKSRRLLIDNKMKAVPSVSGVQKDGGKSEKKLCGKVIFLDVRDSAHARLVELKLRKLNAVIETFLTKEVNYVISSSDSLKAKRHGGSVSPAFSNTPSPFTVTPSATPSPTPTYVNSEGKLAALSRGQALAQMARARNRSPSPSGAVANARRLGVKVIAVEAAEKWLDKELKKQGLTITKETSPQPTAHQQGRQNLSRTRQLLQPFLKVESTTEQFRPQYKELCPWPHLSLNTPSGTCPFDGIGVTVAQRSKGADKEAPASRGNVVSPSTQSNTHRRSLEGDEGSRLVGVPILTAGDLRRKREKRKQEQRKRGYCECCKYKYDDIDEHLKEASHVEYVRDKNNYEVLDDLIGLLPSPSQFLRNTLLRHCSKQQGGKAPASASDPPAVEASSSNDQVITINENAPKKSPQPPDTDHGGGSDVAAPAAVESGLGEEGRGPHTLAYPGFRTPTYTAQYPPLGEASALDSPAPGPDQPGTEEDQPGAGEDQPGAGEDLPGAGEDQPGTGEDQPGTGEDEPDSLNVNLETGQARSSSGPSLPAVVKRRPGARSAYGSPRGKWSQGHSPYRRDSPLTPQKVRERSMVFSNTSIGSLQSVPEDHSPKHTEGLDRRQAQVSGSQDRSRLCGSSWKRQREQSSEASTPGTSVRELASLAPPAHTVTQGSVWGDTPCRARRPKRKRVSNTSLDVEETAGAEASSVTSTQLSRLAVKVEEAGHEEKPRPVDLETDKSNRTLRKNAQASISKKQYSFENVELEEESLELQKMESEQRSEQSKDTGKGVQAKPVEGDCSCLGSPILRSSPRKGPHTPRKQEPGLDGSVAGKVKTPQKRGHQTPQKQSDVEEEELPHSPVYQPPDPSTSTPTFVVIRKLRSTQSGFIRDAKEEGPSAAKTSRRSLLQDDAQPGPSGVPSAERERLESRSRKSVALTNAESPPSESKEGPSGNESLSASEEKPASENKESEERLGSGSKERPEQRSRERSTSKSEEKRSVLGSKTKLASRSEERSASGSKDKASKERSASRSEERSASRSEERSASGSKDKASKERSASRSEERSASRSEERSASGSKDKASKERSASRSEERSASRSEERSASGSKDKASKERSASRSEERSASGSKDKASKERSSRRERSSTESKASSSSPDEERRKTRSQSSQSRRTSKRLSTSKETMRENEVPDSYCRSSDSYVTDDVSRQSAQMPASICSRQTVDEATHGLRIKLVRSPYSRASCQRSTKKVKLSHSWQLLSDNSMSRLLRSDTEVSSFDGFHGDDPLPSDLTYISESEVEVTDDEDREWLMDEEEGAQREGNQVVQSLREFIPTFSSPGKSNSSWDDACDLYVSQSVQQQLKYRHTAPRSPRKDSAGHSQKRQHSSSGRQNARNIAKKRKLKRRAEDESNPEVSGTRTPTKRESNRESKNGILNESEALMRVDKEILCSYNSPCKRQPSGPASPPLKVRNGDLKEVLHQSPKQSRHSALPAKPPPPAFKI